MKATLEFNLPDENSDLVRAVNAGAAWGVLYDIDNRLRGIAKHGLSSESSYEAELREVRKEINEVTALLGEEDAK